MHSEPTNNHDYEEREYGYKSETERLRVKGCGAKYTPAERVIEQT